MVTAARTGRSDTPRGWTPPFDGWRDTCHARLTLRLAALSFLVAFTAPEAAAETLTPEQQLGRRLYEDVNLSLRRNQSCATCHSLAPSPGTVATPGFVDPLNVANGTPVSAGSVPGKTGALNSPSAGYAAFSPAFHWDGKEV